MTIRQLVGDCRVTLPILEPGSVQACITSPPYWGLRDYGTPPLVWGGDPEHAHEWGVVSDPKLGGHGGFDGNNKNPDGTPRTSRYAGIPYSGTTALCECGTWLGSLGLEPTPEIYVEHIVECFRHVHRVLRDDGTLWVNLGDSYASNWPCNRRSVIGAGSLPNGKREARPPRLGGLKEKDLLMIPFRVAMALQADGWYLRSVIPWLKRNSMPESVADRPSTAVEYIFMLSKSARYFYDADAIRQSASENTHSRGNGTGKKNPAIPFGVGNRNNEDFTSRINGHVTSRNRRNSDWFFESWQGLMLDEQDAPLAFVVNPQPLSGAHFATFPPKLVEPMVKASTSERGCCPECGAPWRRVTDKSERPDADRQPGRGKLLGILDGQPHGQYDNHGATIARWQSETTGWRPTCAHTAEPVPCMILDPFSGAGSTLLVADRLGRHAIGCELKPDYGAMSTARIVGDAPMFVELQP